MNEDLMEGCMWVQTAQGRRQREIDRIDCTAPWGQQQVPVLYGSEQVEYVVGSTEPLVFNVR